LLTLRLLQATSSQTAIPVVAGSNLQLLSRNAIFIFILNSR
jgi:hypothetical protein